MHNYKPQVLSELTSREHESDLSLGSVVAVTAVDGIAGLVCAQPGPQRCRGFLSRLHVCQCSYMYIQSRPGLDMHHDFVMYELCIQNLKKTKRLVLHVRNHEK